MSSIRSARFLAASTSLRILLTPVIMGMLMAGADRGLTAALFAAAAATDWIDGYLARRWEVTTKFGSFLDTTADKLLVTGVLIALVAVERASPWVSVIIIGRELMVLGLRGVIAAEGTVMQPSLLGRLKTTHPVPRDPARDPASRGRDRRAVHRRVGHARRRRDHRRLGRRLLQPLRRFAVRAVSRAFLTGGSGFVGGALLTALRERGDDVVALARADAAAAAVSARGAEVARGDMLDEDALAEAMRGCDLVYHVAGVNTLCPDDPTELIHANVRGAEIAVRAAARAGVRRLVLTSSASSLGEAKGTIGNEASPHRGSYMSIYERSKHEGEQAALAAGARDGVDVISVNPSSVQGPGRAGGTGKILIAYLNGRLRAFVDTNISLVDIRDCTEGHLLAAERGRPGERYVLSGVDAHLARGARDRRGHDRRDRAAALAAARRRIGGRRAGRRRLPPRPPLAAGLPGDGPHDAARPPLRRLARRARARPALHAGARDLRTHHRVGDRGRPREAAAAGLVAIA